LSERPGKPSKFKLGNLEARRDWGFAGDYVDAMWRMLQQDSPDDYVLATGETHTVREFTERAFRRAGIELRWEGSGADERGIDAATGRTLVSLDPRYLRPTEVELLLGDASKAKAELGWTPTTTFGELVELMVDADLHLAANEAKLAS